MVEKLGEAGFGHSYGVKNDGDIVVFDNYDSFDPDHDLYHEVPLDTLSKVVEMIRTMDLGDDATVGGFSFARDSPTSTEAHITLGVDAETARADARAGLTTEIDMVEEAYEAAKDYKPEPKRFIRAESVNALYGAEVPADGPWEVEKHGDAFKFFFNAEDDVSDMDAWRADGHDEPDHLSHGAYVKSVERVERER